MQTVHVITLGALSERNLTKEEVRSIKKFMMDNGMINNLLYQSEFNPEDIVSDMINRGIADGKIGNAHIHIEKTEVEKDSIPEDMCTCIKKLSGVTGTRAFIELFRNSSYSEQQLILKTVAYLNKNMIQTEPKFAWNKINITKNNLITLIELCKLLKNV